MRWVDANKQLPIPKQRVLVAMHAGTEWEFNLILQEVSRLFRR